MIKKLTNYFPAGLNIFARRTLNKLLKPTKERVFCISMQRTGTTSTGDFLADHGYSVAGWTVSDYYNWPYLCSTGNYNAIFNSASFNAHNAFEDSPWYHPGMYKKLYHRFPNSKFILFQRDSDKWFDSMIRHSGGKTPGNTFRHCQVYNRLPEFYKRLENDDDFRPTLNQNDNLMSLKGKREHYKKVYESYNNEVISFFEHSNPDRLFTGQLENPDKWKKLGDFLDLSVDNNYHKHSNKS
ncbi:sulfotransferase [Fodinibius sp. AD559]|uniref:sulfotransferase n=1 Tax=Fodinibius sp. AD559 TaxID=3424179 RepID=UPI004046E2E2